EDGIRDRNVTGVQTCALPISRDVAGVRVLSHDAGEGVAAGDLRTLVQDLRSRLGEDAPVVVAVAGHAEGRANLVIATNATAREPGLGAGTLLRTGVQAMGGRGGGKDDMAQGGGGAPEEIGAALSAVRSPVEAAAAACAHGPDGPAARASVATSGTSGWARHVAMRRA